MTTPEQQFIQELEVFRTEAQAGTQFLYAYISFNIIINENKKIYTEINKTPLFWKTVMGSLQTSFFIVLGRIFDQNSTHNIDTLIKIAQNNIGIFSKKALAKRKKTNSSNADKWLAEFLKDIYEPKAHDFRELRKEVNKFRKIYITNYKNIRHQIYAHKEVSYTDAVQQLFSKTNIHELQQVFLFMNALYEALWQMLYNGRKPVLQPTEYSVTSMLHDRKPKWQNQTVQERMVSEVSDLLEKLTTTPQLYEKT